MRALLFGLILAAAAGASRAQDVPPTEVQSTVVIGKTVVEDGKVTMSQSGLTVAPLQETGAEAARRDAAEVLDAGALTPLHQEPQPAETFVAVDNVIVSNKSPSSNSCVQIGVVGTRPGCRPPKQ